MTGWSLDWWHHHWEQLQLTGSSKAAASAFYFRARVGLQQRSKTATIKDGDARVERRGYLQPPGSRPAPGPGPAPTICWVGARLRGGAAAGEPKHTHVCVSERVGLRSQAAVRRAEVIQPGSRFVISCRETGGRRRGGGVQPARQTTSADGARRGSPATNVGRRFEEALTRGRSSINVI